MFHPEDNSSKATRLMYFNSINPALDPATQLTNAFSIPYTAQTIPRKINDTAPPPKNHTNARKYPDAYQWSQIHNQELKKLEKIREIVWLKPSVISK